MIPDEYVFLVLEDFFLRAPVQDEYFPQLFEMVDLSPDIASIQFNFARTFRDGKVKEDDDRNLVMEEIPSSGWKTWFNPTIWHKSTLMKWLRKHESIWGFELYSSQRAKMWNYKEK